MTYFNPASSADEIQFATIQVFKGLDARVVIATDINDLSNKLLLYALLTRARALLYLFVPNEVSIALQEKNIDSI